MNSATATALFAGFLLIGLSACADTLQPGGPVTVVSPPSSPVPVTTAAASATTVLSTMPAVQPSSTVLANVGASGTLSPTQALQRNLALADLEMNAARTSNSLQAAQQHAQIVIDIYVGAWGRWYAVDQVADPAVGHGIFPGERVPAPAPDAPGAELPLGWGYKAYDLGDPKTAQAVVRVMGDVLRWRNNPRASYDEIEAAVAGADPNGSPINKLSGHGTRAVAWARLILVKAASLEQAQQYAGLGSQETGAALAAVQSLPE